MQSAGAAPEPEPALKKQKTEALDESTQDYVEGSDEEGSVEEVADEVPETRATPPTSNRYYA